MKDAPDFHCDRMALVKLDSWHSGRVALVGNAAYCPTANTGMGTTSAIVDAYILAREISRDCRKRRVDGWHRDSAGGVQTEFHGSSSGRSVGRGQHLGLPCLLHGLVYLCSTVSWE